MENGDYEPEQQEKRPARQYFTKKRSNTKRHLGDGKGYKNPSQNQNAKVYQKWRQLFIVSFIIVPIHADASAHIFACPPRQQVPELKLGPYVFRSIKCLD